MNAESSCAIIVVMYFIFNILVFSPLQDNEARIRSSLLQKNAEISAINIQIQQIIEDSSQNQEEQQKQEIQRLRGELAALDLELQNATANLVSPQQMARLLQVLLVQTDGLNLKKVRSLGSSPLLTSLQEEKTSTGREQETEVVQDANVASISAAFRHGLEIEFDGTFFTTLEYLKKLENLEWKFFWDSIEFKVNEYPDSTSTLSIYTISLDKNWIGA